MSFVYVSLNHDSITPYRKHAKVSGEEAPQMSNISEAEIEAAKEEWADLVLSDEE
jgi:hypothetical protein